MYHELHGQFVGCVNENFLFVPNILKKKKKSWMKQMSQAKPECWLTMELFLETSTGDEL